MPKLLRFLKQWPFHDLVIDRELSPEEIIRELDRVINYIHKKMMQQVVDFFHNENRQVVEKSAQLDYIR